MPSKKKKAPQECTLHVTKAVYNKLVKIKKEQEKQTGEKFTLGDVVALWFKQ